MSMFILSILAEQKLNIYGKEKKNMWGFLEIGCVNDIF